MTTLEVLLKARAEVEKGWTRGMAVGVDGGVCAFGAIGVALGLLNRDHPSRSSAGDHAAFGVLATTAAEMGAAVTQISDQSQTSALALFDRAINAQVPVGDSAHVHRVA